MARDIFIIDLGIKGYDKGFVEGHEYEALNMLDDMLLEVTHDNETYRSVDDRGWIFEMNLSTGEYTYATPSITGMTVATSVRRKIF